MVGDIVLGKTPPTLTELLSPPGVLKSTGELSDSGNFAIDLYPV